ncbi:hypothetical protein PFAG_00346 [Plasmodium falciparum Santa Lucia]|uniref:Uncharacterized protein n=6 Tax=Plasmodium falciparum TaxID=5833 RepID=A0A024XEY9_PLAFC|nr:hypothetical protein PFFVO_00415 [Plasmodium falciparum Vietnam Oak-Knoll (FVO)]ETW45119.1 hypothetical protein PFNF135_00448 [Plasmodium falciparum NF135/5.C10]ETW51460.1 hypothetical protein PFMALIP_00436 [Plasmodium falciparum MaliPS096_E11]ETW63665.1 hypothetical protein PFMC_00412 [Plasmodium falciparum CAMP/Malaysia]EUR80920.1 hypothetical protein PFBG_00286 [Plasmodium falciparum 7G8]EUT92206.1 hypothetical protein PFAG_00346 [Plasmodium falciparum Santa Lucia]
MCYEKNKNKIDNILHIKDQILIRQKKRKEKKKGKKNGQYFRFGYYWKVSGYT